MLDKVPRMVPEGLAVTPHTLPNCEPIVTKMKSPPGQPEPVTFSPVPDVPEVGVTVIVGVNTACCAVPACEAASVAVTVWPPAVRPDGNVITGAVELKLPLVSVVTLLGVALTVDASTLKLETLELAANPWPLIVT